MDGGAQPAVAAEPGASCGRDSELKQLIHQWEDLGQRYRELLRRYPGPVPGHHPFSMVGNRPVFLSEKGRTLPPKRQKELRRVQSDRVDLLAIRQPFIPGWWPESRKAGSKAQKEVLEWRELLDNAVSALRAHFEKYGAIDRLSTFPLCRLGKNSPLGEDQLLAAIARHVELLQTDYMTYHVPGSVWEPAAPTVPAPGAVDKKVLNWREVKDILTGWRTNGWPQKLKAERERRGDTQAQAALACGVTQQEGRLMYHKWERGARSPSLRKHAPGVCKYLGYDTPPTEPK